MKSMNPIIPVFIASPDEVKAERKMAESAVNALAHRFAHLFGVTLVPMLWEQFAPISSHDATHPQIGILQRIQPFSIFVGILWNKCGTTVGDTKETGTEMEFNHAIKNRNLIKILSYFKEQSDYKIKNKNNIKQQKQVNELKKRLKSQNITTIDYGSTNKFGQRILPDIMEAAMQWILSKEPRKIADYYNFFKFGSHWRLGTRTLLIVYPPITDPGPGHKALKLDWQKRLLPHVIFEDFKAIQDIEEAMRLLGREYKTVTTDSPTLNMSEPGDRIWVCLPRNKKAQDALEKIIQQKANVRFKFESFKKGEKTDTILRWRKGNKDITIYSPLGKYLKFSERPSGLKAWKPAYGHSYCRDYAILARFKLLKDPEDQSGEFYYHYFIGGIRGLGTWGVGHFIDHFSSKLVRYSDRQLEKDDSENVQMLLEVTFENFRVTKVKNVSEKDKNYFATRNSDSYVIDQLKKHPDWIKTDLCIDV